MARTKQTARRTTTNKAIGRLTQSAREAEEKEERENYVNRDFEKDYMNPKQTTPQKKQPVKNARTKQTPRKSGHQQCMIGRTWIDFSLSQSAREVEENEERENDENPYFQKDYTNQKQTTPQKKQPVKNAHTKQTSRKSGHHQRMICRTWIDLSLSQSAREAEKNKERQNDENRDVQKDYMNEKQTTTQKKQPGCGYPLCGETLEP